MNNKGSGDTVILIIFAIVLVIISCFSCNRQNIAKNYGGEMTLDLNPGEKLELITWKDSELWILTRPMEEDEKPIKWTYAENSEFGILEGTIYIQEYSISENKAE